MTGICWRLLAAFLLIVVASIFVAPRFLRGQDAAADRAPIFTSAPQALRNSPPTAPVWIPPPGLLRPHPAPPGDTFFPRLIRAAGIIFSGRVTAIGRVPSSSGQASASTTVTFQVEHAMRGTLPGQSLTIHEWAGLWTSGERYRVGDQVLLFLYSPSRLGLTSPVAGGIGRFAMDSQGRVVMNAQHVALLAADPILGGKTLVSYADFVQALRRSSGEE